MIKKWSVFKRVITVRLAHISQILLMDLKKSNYCSTSRILNNWLKQRFYIAIERLFLSFLILNTVLHFLMIINTWRFHLLNRQGVGLEWFMSFPFPYKGLLV